VERARIEFTKASRHAKSTSTQTAIEKQKQAGSSLAEAEKKMGELREAQLAAAKVS
jgi:hypothetical protein